MSRTRHRQGGFVVQNIELPKCRKCGNGELLPMSDYGRDGAPITYKAWVCSNPECGFNLKIRNGDLYMDEPISNGAVHTPRYSNR